jgi:alanine racemase
MVGIGPLMCKYSTLFTSAGLKAEMFISTGEFISQFHPLQYRDEVVLLKGARVYEFERINQLLEVKLHQTVLSVNLSAISHNLSEYRKFLSPQTKIMVMVKAFSYGSGSYEIANLMQYHKVDYLAVAYTDEGTELRKAGISTPIMVMNPEEASFPAITGFDLQPEIFSFQLLKQFGAYLKSEGITEYPIHLKLDTGMHRLGFEPSDLQSVVSQLKDNNLFRVISVFTHLTGSEDPAEDDFTRQQVVQFTEAAAFLSGQLGYSIIRHISNTAAIHRHPQLQMDMVRLGIGLYGSGAGKGRLHLQEASSLTTTIAQIREVRSGESVGYNRMGVLQRDSRIATIRIGYADGYPRSLSNGIGKVMIRNKLVPVVGLVCMDMTMVDVTDIPGLEEGEEVLIFGKGLSVNDLANWAGTIPYDIMTGISQRVKRVYFEE